MKIRLKEIPQDGRSYVFDRSSAELNEVLQDLVGENDYSVELYIKPIGNVYEMTGSLKTVLPETCSHCGYEFELPIDRRIKEVLFEELAVERKSQSVHGNHSVDFEKDGLSMTPVQKDVFNAGEFVHEMVALSEPLYPMCGPNGQCLRAKEVEEIRRRLDAESDITKEEKPNPFTVLKGLDLRKKN
jgi:uncharacterized protein